MSTKKPQLTPHQFTLILLGSMLGVGMLSLPGEVLKTARQDSWISIMIGGIYPIYMLLLANFFVKNHPDDNILSLSKMYFGKLLGSILNFIFVTYFIALVTMITSGTSNILRVYMTYYLTNEKLLMTIFLVPAFIAFKGLKTLGRFNEIIFYFTIAVFIIPFSALKDGSILNIMPLLGSGFINIFKSLKDTVFSYAGIEIVFLLYPLLKDKKKMKSCSFISATFTILVYTWLTFITIHYFGIYITPKYIWPVITLSEVINIPVISSFRFITLSLWSLIGIKIISIHYYSSAYGLSKMINKLDIKKLVYILYPVFFFLTRYYGPPTTRETLVSKLMFFYVIFNILYISTIAINIFLKKGDKYAK